MKNKLIASSALAAAMVIGGSTYVLPVSADSIAEEVTEIGEEAMERVGTIQVWLNVGELSEPVSKGYCELPTELPPTDGDEESVEEDDGDEEPPEEDEDDDLPKIPGPGDWDLPTTRSDMGGIKEDDYVPMSAARFGVIEVSADSVDIDLSGVEFNLMKDGEVIATASTNEEGLAEFTDVAEGDYVIEQVTALDGFEIYSEQAEVTLTVASDESECMTEVQWFNDNEDSEDVEDDKKEEEPEDNGDNESETGDKEPETDGDDNNTEDNGDDKEPEVDLPDPGVNLPEEDGDDKEPEAGDDDKEPETDGDDKEPETDGGGDEGELEITKPAPKPAPKPAMPTPALSVDGEYMQAGGQSGKVVQTSDVAAATSWSLGSLGLAIVNLLKRKRK